MLGYNKSVMHAWLQPKAQQHLFRTRCVPLLAHVLRRVDLCATAQQPALQAACSRMPLVCRGGRVAKLVDGLVSDLVKRLVLNPEYMRAAWMREVENSLVFGMTTDEMLVAGLTPDSHRLPHFAGTHCYPMFPGAAAQCVPSLPGWSVMQ